MLAIPTLAHFGTVTSSRTAPDAGPFSTGEDPLVLARRWEALGFQRLYVRELPETDRKPETADLVRELTRQDCLPLQLESPADDDSDIESLLELGVDVSVSGGRGIGDPGWLESLAVRYAGRISLVVDLRAGRLLQRGREPRREVFDLLDELAGLPLGALVVALAPNASRVQPAELTRLEELASRASWPLAVLGAPVSLVELRNLEERGVAAAVLPMTWDHEALDPRLVAEEFASAD